MQPTIKLIDEKKVIGIHVPMSVANNKTAVLWQRFMPRRKEIKNKVSEDLISMQIYDPTYFSMFDPEKEFNKWASVEVDKFEEIPQNMEIFIIPAGKYAVFHYKGLSTNTQIFEDIFGTWLPQSAYEIDHRPHFEILGEKYKNNDPDSEEDIWIPIREK